MVHAIKDSISMLRKLATAAPNSTKLAGLAGLFATIATRDFASNLVGGIMLRVLNPFDMNNNISFRHGGLLIEGSVFQRGLYYTIVRTKDFALHYVPNSAFLSSSVSNLSRLRLRYFEAQLPLPMSHADKVPAIAAAVKERLSAHPEVQQKLPLTANLATISPNGLMLQASCYFLPDSTQHARDVQQALLLDLIAGAQTQAADSSALPTVVNSS